jgi:Putative Flp pilus-assembly TadE/G-like
VRDLIRGLARPALRLLRRDERGVVAVLVGLLIGTVLLGLGALVIDVGQLYGERAQLQNGADAAAIAVAKSCVLGTCTNGSALSTAVTYAGKNAKDGVAAVPLICGSGSLGSCAASTLAMTDCPAPPAAGTNYVDVHTATAASGGGTVVAPVFAKALLGNGNYTGTTVLACSQAQWGGPAAANAIAFAISACDWDAATSLGTVFASPPPAVPPSSYDRVLKVHGSAGSGCSTEPAGSDSPGNFGWTNDPTSTCTISIGAGTFGGNPGAPASNACKAALATAQASKSVLFIAIYTKITGTGANSVYTLKGFGAFVVTGYNLPGASASDWLQPLNNCSGSNKCINGYFTQGIIPDTGSMSSTYLGAAVIKVTG